MELVIVSGFNISGYARYPNRASVYPFKSLFEFISQLKFNMMHDIGRLFLNKKLVKTSYKAVFIEIG